MKRKLNIKMATLLSALSLSLNMACFFQQISNTLPVEASEGTSAGSETKLDWKTFDPAKFKGSKEQLIPPSGGKYKSTPIFPMNPTQKGILTVPVNGEAYPVGLFAHQGTRLLICKQDKTCVPAVAPQAGAMLRVNRGIGVPSCTIYGTTDYTPINYGDYKLTKILSGGQVYFYGDPKNNGGEKKYFWDLNRMFFSSSINPKDSGFPRLIYLNPGESVCVFSPDGSSGRFVKAPSVYTPGWNSAAKIKDGQNKDRILEIKQKPPNPVSPGKISGTEEGIAVFDIRVPAATPTTEVTLDNLSSGKIKVVLFTAYWCPYCDKYDPVFKQIMQSGTYAKTCDFQIVEEGSGKTSVLLQQKYKVTGFPTTVITDTKGNELIRADGYFGENSAYWLTNYIEQALKKVSGK